MLRSPADWTERSHDLSRLLARAGLGDRAAFATLYERTSSHLLAVVLRINRDRAQAEDILQEVYVNVWRAASSFDAAQSQPLTWLTSIARNRAIDSLRRLQTQPQMRAGAPSSDSRDSEDDDVYDTVADESPGPLDLLSRAAEARSLAACMDQLSPSAAAERRARVLPGLEPRRGRRRRCASRSAPSSRGCVARWRR